MYIRSGRVGTSLHRRPGFYAPAAQTYGARAFAVHPGARGTTDRSRSPLVCPVALSPVPIYSS